MNIDEYFASLERSLTRNSLVNRLEEPFTCLASDDHNGLVRGRVFFWDESFLDLYEVVSTELGLSIRVSYAYTDLRAGQRVFRYDSASHHPMTVTFPHHKQFEPQDRICTLRTRTHIAASEVASGNTLA